MASAVYAYNPAPPPRGPLCPTGAKRLNERWREYSLAFPMIPRGAAHSSFRAVRRSEPRAWPGLHFLRDLLVSADDAARLPLGVREVVRSRGEAVLAEIGAQYRARLVLPSDLAPRPLHECAGRLITDVSAVTAAVLAALADGTADERELDAIDEKLRDAEAKLEEAKRASAAARAEARRRGRGEGAR